MTVEHVCPGETCPHVINTGEAWVCTLTGKCLETVFMPGYDFISSSSVEKTKTPAPVTQIYECKIATKQTREEPLKEDVYGECYRVVQKLLGKENKLVNKKNSGAVRAATKKAHAVFKKKIDKKNRTRLLPAISEFLEAFQNVKQTGGGNFRDDGIDLVARRCQKCCELTLQQSDTQTNKVKVEYICVAAVYLLREGVIVKGIKIAEKDEEVKKALPNLNSLDTFGFSKSKYTKAERFIREAIQKAIYARPIHTIAF